MNNEIKTGNIVLATAVALKVAKATCLYGVKLGGEFGSRRPYTGAAIAGGSALLLKVFIAAAILENRSTIKKKIDEFIHHPKPK